MSAVDVENPAVKVAAASGRDREGKEAVDPFR